MTNYINKGIGVRHSVIVQNHEWLFTRTSKDNLVLAIDSNGDTKVYAKRKINPNNYMHWEEETILEMLVNKLDTQQLNISDLEKVMFELA